MCTNTSRPRARETRKEVDRLSVDAWNKRMLAFKRPAQPSPTLGEALNAGYGDLEVRCLAATRTRPLHSTLSPGRRRHRSMSWSAECVARAAHQPGAYRTGAAIW